MPRFRWRRRDPYRDRDEDEADEFARGGDLREHHRSDEGGGGGQQCCEERESRCTEASHRHGLKGERDDGRHNADNDERSSKKIILPMTMPQ